MTNPARPIERIPWLRREALLALCFILVSFGLNWFYLSGGFQADEFFFLNALREDPLPFSRWLGFWSVEEVSAISGIWWFEGGDWGSSGGRCPRWSSRARFACSVSGLSRCICSRSSSTA